MLLGATTENGCNLLSSYYIKATYGLIDRFFDALEDCYSTLSQNQVGTGEKQGRNWPKLTSQAGPKPSPTCWIVIIS